MKIDVALATYNGALYIDELLNSIANQTKLVDRIIVRDDGSTDNTNQILQFWKNKGLRISVLPNGNKNLGITANFNFILQNTTADYVLLCDQDDVWLPNKVEELFNSIASLEKVYGNNMPALVFSDMKIVDKDMKSLSNSGMKYQGFYPKRFNTFKKALIQNIVPGCSAMINQCLLKLALPIPEGAIMHDWWIVLVASAFGKISYVDKPLFCYRQHPDNALGASVWNAHTIKSKITDFKLESKRIYCDLMEAATQAEIFYERYKTILPKKHKAEVNSFLELINKQSARKVIESVKLGFCKQGILRTIGFYISLWREG